jgi:hypothetical protein
LFTRDIKKADNESPVTQMADKVIAGKQLYDKNCCCYYLEPWSVICGVTLPNSAFHMPISSLHQNHFNNIGEINNHDSVNASVLSGQLNSDLHLEPEVTVENNTEIQVLPP